jgi:DUF1680 family protein
MRTLASLQHYLATTDAGGVQLHHYASGAVGPLRIATGYPWDGRVGIEVAEAGEWTLSLRVPAWAQGATVDGEPVAAGEYARVHRSWRPGDTVTLELPLAPRLTAPHPRIDAVRGCLAIERGPLVYCIEGADAPAGALLDDLRLDASAPLGEVQRPDLLGGIVAVGGAGVLAPPDWDPDWAYAPVGAAGDGAGGEVPLVAVPYALWGNRGGGPMRVWIPTAG